LLPFWAITIAFCIIIDLIIAHKFPMCDNFYWFCKIARFFATEPLIVDHDGSSPLQANRDVVGSWETFEMIHQDDKDVAFRAVLL
jgi:hypothetical protein